MDIYLAGAEGGTTEMEIDQGLALHLLEYPYRLSSYHYMRRSDGSLGTNGERLINERQHDEGSRWIMDSGLFTLMYGPERHRGVIKDLDDLRRYCTTYIENLIQWGWKHPIVECDAQDKFGIDAIERVREEIFRQAPFEVLYVWHVPDGESALAALCAREKWVSCSLPEFRKKFGPGVQLQRALLAFLQRCRAASSVVSKIHLLGNSASNLVHLPAQTCDSTSWLTPARFGNGYLYEAGVARPASIYSPKWDTWLEWCRKAYPEPFDSLLRKASGNQRVYWSNAMASAIAFWMLMESSNG